MDDYVIDADGNRVYPGDYVQCIRPDYSSIAYGERRRVQKVVDGKITLRNHMSPIGTSDYAIANFKLCGRHHPWHRHNKIYNQKEAGIMLHLAVRVEEGQNYNSVANNINANERPIMISDVSASALKEKVRFRINANPLERWLILSGNTIAESAAPPITFRQW